MVRPDKARIEAVYPLSAMQQGMVFHSLREPESGLYFNSSAYRFESRVDEESFKRAWQRVVERHAILRTAFALKHEAPLQVVFSRVGVTVECHDWSSATSNEQQVQLSKFMETHRRCGFDFSRAPLMKLALLRTSEEESLFVWSFHHVLLDGWSAYLALKEVIAFYEAFHDGKDLTLAEPRPYRDYIVWLQAQDLRAAEAFWKYSLERFESPTTLPLECQRNSENSEQKVEVVWLSRTISQRLRSFGIRNQVTSSTTIQGLWGLLLSRYSGEKDVLFGATVSGRPVTLPGAESMVGLFINTIPVRVRVSHDRRLRDWLVNLQTDQAAAQQYSYAPLVNVRSWSEVSRGLPLFESLVVVENYTLDAFEAAYANGRAILSSSSLIKSARLEHSLYKTNYPLLLTVRLGEETMFQITYDSARFACQDIQHVLNQLLTFVERLTLDPEQRVGELAILSAEEREQLLYGWNDTRTEYPADRCVHELFEEQAERTPDAVAVVFEDSELSYGELNRRANRVAHCLIGLGVKPDTRVALCVERSLEMVVALLGVLKAGAAYVPLDPDWPVDRLALLLDDTRAAIVLTQEGLSAYLPATLAQVLVLDSGWDEVAGESERNSGPLARAEHLAYVIYTSGSTGEPKGVGVEHRHLLNYVHAISAEIGIGPQACALVSTLAADLGHTVLFPPLCGGGTLHLISNERSRDGRLLAEYAREHALECMKISPSHLAGLLAVEFTADLIPHGRLILGGEASSSEWVEKVQQLRPECEIWNHYGPTECTVGALTYLISGDRAKGGIALGRPLANTRAYVVDRNEDLLPIGVGGELLLAGAGWLEATWGAHQRQRSDLPPMRFRGRAARVFTTREIRCGGAVTECWSFWAGSTIRSRFVVSEWSRMKSRKY